MKNLYMLFFGKIMNIHVENERLWFTNIYAIVVAAVFVFMSGLSPNLRFFQSFFLLFFLFLGFLMSLRLKADFEDFLERIVQISKNSSFAVYKVVCPLLFIVDVVMLPIMGFPGVVEESAGFFRPVFSWHQFRRFKQYLSGLITGRRPTVRGIASRLVEPTDQSSLNRFLTLYRWDEERVNRERLDKRCWAYTRVLDVNKLGRARVVICYDRTIGAECRQAFRDLLQNLVQWSTGLRTSYR